MSNLVRIGIVCAVAFAIWGDYYLKRYSVGRGTVHLVTCLLLWEVCALCWVFVYRQRVSLGRTTALGAAIAVVGNTAVGIGLFDEKVDWRTAAGIAAALVSVGLLA